MRAIDLLYADVGFFVEHSESGFDDMATAGNQVIDFLLTDKAPHHGYVEATVRLAFATSDLADMRLARAPSSHLQNTQQVCVTAASRQTRAAIDIAKQLLLRVETALANARWLKGRTGIEGENPSTSVNAVVQHMKDVGSRP